MNHDEPTDAQLEDLLGTYAEALYQSSVVPDGQQTLSHTAGGLTATNNNPKGITVEDHTEQAALEVDLQPTNNDDSNSKGKVLALVGAFVLAAAVGIGAVAVIGNNDESSLDVAEAEELVEEDVAATDEEAESEDSAPIEEAAEEEEEEEEADLVDDAATSGVAEDVVGTSSFFDPFGSGTVFVDGDFATLSNGGDGYILQRGIGDDAVTEATTGLPDGESSFVSHLVATDAGFAALIEVFTDFDETEFDEFGPFEPGTPPAYLVATSTNMVDWTTVELPPLVDEVDLSVYVSSLAASGDQILVVGQVSSFTSPERVLLDAGRINEEDVYNICSTDFTDTTYTIHTCDFENSDGFEQNFDEEPLISIDESDPLFAEVMAANDAQNNPETVVAVGPASGPFQVADGPIDGFDLSIAGTPDGFLAIGSTNEGRTEAFTSANGLTWNEAATPPGAENLFGFSSLAANGDTIVAVTQSQAGLNTSTTADLGQTWTESSIDTELFFPFGDAVAGPAGFAIQIQGGLEPFETGFPDDQIELSKDGYTMTIEVFNGTASLTGPDGVVHEDVLLFGDDIDNIVRFEGPFDEDLIWLDPATGEDLITFSESDFEAAFPEPEFGENFEEPEMANETWFSADGTSWTLLESGEPGFDSFGGVLAVGDDEVVTFNQVFTEPPEELLNFENGFEPTEEEEAALDAWFMENGDQTTYNVIPVG